MSSSSNKKEVMTAAAATGLAIVSVAWWYSQKKQKKFVFPVDYNKADHYPFPVRMISYLPCAIRRPLLIKGSAPKQATDAIDLGLLEGTTGGNEKNKGRSLHDPFEIVELEPGKLWRVRYTYVDSPELLQDLKEIFGVDMAKAPDAVDESNPSMKKAIEDYVKVAETAINGMKNKTSKLPKKECDRKLLRDGFTRSQDMLVARLPPKDENINKDKLLLYNPCRMHPRILNFLNDLGTVEYIVSGSSCHTNQVPGASEAFPNANVVCAASAAEKCAVVGMKSPAFVYTDHSGTATSNPTGYQALVAELAKYQIKVLHVQGDAMTQALVLVVDGHLFETDLVYGDGHKRLFSEPEDWTNFGLHQIDGARAFYYGVIASGKVSPGYLPDYRVMGMDSTSLFAKMMLDPPNEAESCTQMATSLRTLLKMEFQYVDSVHSERKKSIQADEFRRCLDQSWKWLLRVGPGADSTDGGGDNMSLMR